MKANDEPMTNNDKTITCNVGTDWVIYVLFLAQTRTHTLMIRQLDEYVYKVDDQVCVALSALYTESLSYTRNHPTITRINWIINSITKPIVGWSRVESR